MKPEQFSDAMNYLEDELIEEGRATGFGSEQRTMPAEDGGKYRTKRSVWVRRAAAAACLTLCLGGGVWLWQNGSYGQQLPVDPTQPDVPQTSAPSWTPSPDLPVLTVQTDDGAGMGFEGLLFYDISELKDANPWTEDARLTALPVYRNSLKSNRAGEYEGASIPPEIFTKMRELLLQTAGQLGLDSETLVITDNALSEEEKAAIREKYRIAAGEEPPEEFFAPTRLEAEQDGVRMTVEADMNLQIEFDPPIVLPEEYPLDFQMTLEEAQAAAGYLLQRYSDLIGMEDPRVNLRGGDYDIYGEHGYDVAFYEGEGDLTQQILHYNFAAITFIGSEEGRLWMIRRSQTDLSDLVGVYPILSAEQARQQLLEGSYITSVPGDYGVPSEERIARTELVYRQSRWDDYFMPYYRFYVELPGMERDNGLKTFGAFYVPAVQPQYLNDWTVWDGSFN